jgi:hypothetical protein
MASRGSWHARQFEVARIDKVSEAFFFGQDCATDVEKIFRMVGHLPVRQFVDVSFDLASRQIQHRGILRIVIQHGYL